ncbi:MAG: hypothetical protein NUW21_03690 [Elusimicrobia bacterium]|nr:hypothetical protein [Elusimicrobiota bacterium]
MRRPSLRHAAVALIAPGALFLSGCVGFTVKPPKPSAMPRAESPAPLKVGVLMKKPRFEWRGMGPMNTAYMERHRDRWMLKPMWTQADDVGGKFLRALQSSAGFARVDEVKSLGFHGTGGESDLLIDAEFSGKYTQDPGGFGKAFITGFLLFLPAPFIRYEDAYFAAAELSVYDRAGRLLHKYSERQDVVSSAALFSAGSPGSVSAGIDAAASHLASKLVTAILADREGYERAVKQAPVMPEAAPALATVEPAPPIPSEPAASAEPVEQVKTNAEAAHAALDAEAAKSEPAPTSQASATPQPERRGPLTSDEEAEIDEQVMP